MKCDHPQKKLCKQTCADGTFRRVNQCQTCGQREYIPRNVVTEGKVSDLPEYSEELIKAWGKKCSEYWKEQAKHKQEEYERQITEKSQQAKEWYSKYLASSTWKQKRRETLERDRYQCKGCCFRRATEVHHLTYDNVGDELLFQLISLCEICHYKVHNPTPKDQIIF